MLASGVAALVAACGSSSATRPPLTAASGLKSTGTAPVQHTRRPSSNRGNTPGQTSARTRSTCNPATTTIACPIERITLKSPTSSSTFGIAEVLEKGNTTAIAIVAQGVPANTSHNAYALWLYNSAFDAVRLGFVNPGVGKNGRLATAGGLPANAGHYKDLLITLETQPHPRTPGPIVLKGPFAK